MLGKRIIFSIGYSLIAFMFIQYPRNWFIPFEKSLFRLGG